MGAVVRMRRYRVGEHVIKKLEERRVPSGWYVKLRECSWAGAVSQDSGSARSGVPGMKVANAPSNSPGRGIARTRAVRQPTLLG